MLLLNNQHVHFIDFPNKERRLDLPNELVNDMNTVIWHYENTVKWELAKHGYFPEYFLNSNVPGVATYALKAHPEYLPELIKSTKSEHIHAAHNILIDKQDPTEDELLTHIYILNDQMQNDPQDYGGFSQIDLRAEMRMKIAAEKINPTTIEKTMSREQLYDAKNIAWAKGLTVREIDQWRLEYDKKHPFIDMETLHKQEGWLDMYYEDDE